MQFDMLLSTRRRTTTTALALFAALIGSPTKVSAVPDPVAGSGGSYSAAAPAAQSAAVAPAAPRPVPVTLTANIDLTSQQMTVSSGGKVLNVYRISSGKVGHETPRGTFRPQWASKMHYSKKYDDAPMPHSVFFNGGIATHGTQSLGMLGRPASHGCIRLNPSAAAAFYALVHKHGFASTRIIVRGTPPHHRGDELVASRRNWDNDRQRIARRQLQPVYPVAQPTYGYAYGYGYGASYGYAPYTSRPVYVIRRPQANPNAGQMRYAPGLVRYR